MKRVVNIYTDGSHLKHTTGRLGIGGILVIGGQEVAKFSREISTDFLKKNFGTTDVSNPTCEMLAALFALKIFKDKLQSTDEVHMKADYLGVQAWNLGLWRIKAPYIQKIKDAIDKEIQDQGLQGRIFFNWVKGHQKSILDPDALWNSKVDLLAKTGSYE